MRIAMLGQKGVPAVFGGIERHVEELAKRLAARGHEVIVYCRPWYVKKSEIRNQNPVGLKAQVVPTIRTKHLDAIVHTFIATIHAMVRVKPDIYHYHGVGPALLAWLPRILRPQARVLVTFHCIDRKHQKWGLPARLLLRAGEWAACRFPHATITVSRTLEEYCQNVYESNTTYIPNGVTTPSPHPSTSRREGLGDGALLIKRFGLRPGGYLAMVSRLVRHKGAHYLIRAWNELQIQAPELIGDLKLVFVGDGAFTDDYVRELKLLAGEDPSIVFTGFQSGATLDELFANALLIVHPSESEGLPIAVLEAMSYGKVVLASDIPENMEVIRDHGFSFPNGNVVALKDKLIELLACRERLAEIGSRGREFVLQNYHWDDIAAQVETLYKETRQLKPLRHRRWWSAFNRSV